FSSFLLILRHTCFSLFPYTTLFRSSTGVIDTYLWDFGDGNTSADQNPVHTFTAPGTYTVELTVTGPGGTDTATLPIEVTAPATRSEEHTSELQSRENLVCRLLLEKK